MSGRILSSVFTINKKTTLLETFSLYSNNERKKKPEINRSIDHYKSYFSLSLSPVLSRPSWEGKMIGRQNEERRRRRQEAVNSSTFNILYKFITRNKISSARDEKEKWRFAEMKRGGRETLDFVAQSKCNWYHQDSGTSTCPVAVQLDWKK